MDAKSKLIFFELGSKGNSTLIQTVDAHGNTIYGIVDGGKPSSYSQHIEPYLRENNINRISFIIVSHTHVDHTGGIEELLQSNRVDSGTILYLKDTPKSEFLIDYAKQKDMNIGIVEPLSSPVNVKDNTDVMNTPDDVFKTRIKYYSKVNGEYTNTRTEDHVSFGEFNISIYNGVNWNTHYIVDEAWDENVNSLTCLLERTSKKGMLQRIYLNADLGENSGEDLVDGRVQYSMVIGERISQIIGQVDVYQVAHHGFYFSMNSNTAKNLNFKYAVVTNGYTEIAGKGIIKFQKKYPSISKEEALNIGTNTLKSLFSSQELKKVIFTDGENCGNGATAYEIINELQPSNGYTLADQYGYIKNGHVTIELSDGIFVSQ